MRLPLDLVLSLGVWKPALRSLPPPSESFLLQLSSSEEVNVVSINTEETEDSPPLSLACE